MTAALRFALFGLLTAFPAVPLHGQDGPSARTLLAWLKGLTLEARLDLERADGSQPRLFTRTTPDGRTWMKFITDGFAGLRGADWALADEAAGLLLEEAEHLDALLDETTDPQVGHRLRTNRKRYLEGAAGILAHHASATNEVYDETLALIPNPLGLSDWVLPGEIQIKEAAGSARLNTTSGEFRGRLSGMLELPSLETMLTVPNFSFDSRGNIDLTAYGQTVFPPNDPDGVTLTIPSRRPLEFHLADDGDFSIAGGLRLGFPDGNKVEGYFDIDDPEYEFGLSFSGAATLDLARELTLVLPTLDEATVYSPEAIDGFARFYGALGNGIETFLDESPDRPSVNDLNVGAPPEFKTSEAVIPFDVFDAWLIGLTNEDVRPTLNGSLNDSTDEIQDLLSGAQRELQAVQRGIAPTLNEIKRLRRIDGLFDEIGGIAEVANAQIEAGLIDEDEYERLILGAGEIAVANREIAKEYLDLLPPETPFKTGLAALNLYLEADKAVLATTTEDVPVLEEDFLVRVTDKLDQWAATLLAGSGLGPDGNVLDPETVEALRPEDVRVLFLFAVDQHEILATLATDENLEPELPTPLMVALGQLELGKVKTLYESAIASGDEASRALYASRLSDLGSINLVFDFTDDEDDRALMAGAIADTFEAIRGADSSPERERLAWKILDAAKRNLDADEATTRQRLAEIFGGAEARQKAFAERAVFSSTTPSFYERWYRGIEAVIDAGVVDAVRTGELEANLASFMKFFAEAQASRFNDAALIEQNLDDAYAALVVLTDLLAIAEDLLPGDDALIPELQQSWEAVHVPLIGVAEAKRLHWVLARYAREIAAATTRYGDGLSGALLTAYQENGSEAIGGLGEVIGYLEGIVNGIGSEEFQFALPGDITIEELYGEVAFNRETLAWALAFGGRLSFPDINAVFEVPRATLDHTGTFSLEMLAASDSAFGLSDDFALEFAIPGNTGVPFTGTLPLPSNNFAAALDSFGGMGTLYYRKGQPEEQMFTAAVTYMALYEEMLLTGHQFTVDATASTQLELFTEEIMLFNGGVGFDLTTTVNGIPTQGGASVQLGDPGSPLATPGLGFLLRSEAQTDPALRTAADYYLTFSGAARFDFTNQPGNRIAQVTLESGVLTLPPDIFQGPGDSLPTISLASPVCVQFDFENPLDGISWCDVNGNAVRLAINNIGFQIPGLADSEATNVSSNPDPGQIANPEDDIPGFEFGVSAVVLLTGNAFPVIEKIDANLVLPIPGNSSGDPNSAANVTISGEDWRIDGLPGRASITLNNTVRLLDLGGFFFDLLGGTNEVALPGGGTGTCQTTLTFTSNPDGSVLFEFFGGMRAGFQSDILYEKEDDSETYQSFAATVCGQFAWDLVNAPTFALDVVLIEGLFRLGGENGIGVQGIEDGEPASLAFIGLQNIFNQSPSTPFEIVLDGALDIAGYATFGLADTSFVFAGNGIEFRPGAFVFEAGENSIDIVDGFLPAYLTAARLDFKANEGLTLEQLLAPTNLILTVSGEINLPNKDAIDSGSPGISGQVDDFSIELLEQGDGSYLPQVNANGFGMQIQNLDIPPLGDLTGGLYIGNLQHPEQLYFAGVVGGKINGMGAKILLAIDTNGVIGACFDLNAGPGGITLPYGFQLTGATGGLSFLNGFADPCDFSDYIRMQTDPADGIMKPVNDGESDTFTETGDPEPPMASEPWEHCLVENAGGQFPIDSVNPLCMPHPDVPNRIVYKGTILDATALANLGITASTPELTRTVDEAVAFASSRFRDAIVGTGDEFLTLIDGITPDNPAYQYIQSLIDLALDGAEDMARASIRNLLLGPVDCDTDGMIGTANVAAGDDPSFYDIVLELAQCGIPCQDVTLKVKGKFSHVAVSSFLYGDVGVTLSTTGSVGVEGSINVMGIPVGDGQFVYQITDTNGNINPSFGGIANVGVGPLEFGSMSFGYRCDDCYTALGQAFLDLMVTHFNVTGTAANDLLVRLMDRAVPLDEPRDPNVSAAVHFALIETSEERVAFITEVFNIINLKADDFDELQRLYGPGIEDVFMDLMAGFKTFLVEILEAVDMTMCFKADVTPKIFGFPLVAGDDGLGAELSFATRVEDPPESGIFYQELNGQAIISPSQMLSFALLGASGAIIPPADRVGMGFSLRVPAFDADIIAIAVENPLAFADAQMSKFINDAVVTFDYQLQPLGLKLANGQARAIMPRFDEHPDRAGINWSRPDGEEVATRSEVILASLNKNLLSDTSWRGRSGQLSQLFEGEDPDGCAQGIVAIRERLDRSEMDQLDLAVDYFPYGGLIGGAELELPDFLTELPPPNFSQLFVFPDAEGVPAWIDNATEVLNEYLLASTCVGQMAIYVPAPSPGGDNPFLDPNGFWEAIKGFDINDLIARSSPNYPIGELMLNGWLEVPILGLPVMRGEMDYEEDSKVFTAHLQVPETSWVSDFLTAANLDVTIEAPPYLRDASSEVGLEDSFQPVINAIASADRNAPLSDTVYDGFVNVVRDSLPKVSFEAAASLNAIPPELQPYLTNTSDLTLYGFSFAHSPDHAPDSSDPYDIAKQRGGLGLRGSFEFGFAPAGISINVEEAGMSLTPSDGSTFPALNGTVQVTDFDPLPGVIPRFRDGELTFSGAPNNEAPWIRVAGNIEPFKFTLPGTQVDLLSFSAPRGRDLGANLEILRDDGQPFDTATRLLIDPATATMPFLGQDLAITVHGDTINDQFPFSTAAGETWSAKITISSLRDPAKPPSFVVRDPSTPRGDILARITPNDLVTGSIVGTGLQSFNLQLNIPCGGTLTFFEGQDAATTIDLGASSSNCVLFIDHLGRFFVDLGEDRGIDLPGVLEANAHVVFGFNSTGSHPVLDIQDPTSVDFGAVDLGLSSTREFTVRNLGLATAVATVTTNRPADYTVTNGTFTLDPGQSHEVAVVFHPQELGARDATLAFSSNDPVEPEQTIDLKGEGTGTPQYFQSRDAIDFGPTVLGGISTGTLTIGNSGTAPLTVVSMRQSGSNTFSVRPALTGRTFAPGEQLTYEVSFSPLSIRPFEGSLTINVQGEPDPFVVSLDGNGAESQWFTIRDASIAGYDSNLNDVYMENSLQGHAVGDGGVVLQTLNGGHSWIRRDFTKFDLDAIIPRRGGFGRPTIAEYHFEDSANDLSYRDDSGNGYHASTTSGSKPKRVDTSSAVEGATSAWMSFSGIDNYLDLGDFAMDTGNFAISMWLKPLGFGSNQAYIGKNAANGDNQFIFGYYNGEPRVYLNNQNQAIPVTLTTDWQHIYLGVFSNAVANRTDVRVYRNGSFVDTLQFPGTYSIPSGGRPWMLGAEWDGNDRTDFAAAGMDEVYFIDGSLNPGVIQVLANGGARTVIVGDGGMAFQSHTGGAKWRQVPDPDVYGWRGFIEGFDPKRWRGGGFDDDGRLFLVGDSAGQAAILAEQANGDFAPGVISGGTDANAFFTHGFSTLNRIFATSSTGRVYRATDTLGSWSRQGSNRIAGGALGGHVWNINAAGYAVVGANGGILRSASGSAPALVPSGTTADLHAADHVGTTNTWHVVGDGGAYLTSSGGDSSSWGTNWNVNADGLTGNNRGVSAVGSDVWVAGDNQQISFRPDAGPDQPFLVFDPGELDFGFLLLGEAKTLPLRVYNRGRRDLEISNVGISGSGFTIFQGSIERLAPGDWVTLLVRYKPATASDQDLGTLTLETPEREFRIPLTGRVSERKWRPRYVRTSGGDPVPGQVVDMDWTSSSRGYALVRNGGASSIWRTSNGGISWIKSTLPFLRFPVTLNALDMVGSGNSGDDGYAVGSMLDARNSTTIGVILKTLNGTGSWEPVPLPLPNDEAVYDVSMDGSARRVVVVAASNLWESDNEGDTWTSQFTNLPQNYAPRSVTTFARTSNAASPFIFSSQDEKLFWRTFGGVWGTGAHLFTFPSGQNVNDYTFFDDPSNDTWAFDYGWVVGDNGLFWRQEASPDPYQWTTADNAEVFATTDLQSIDLHRNSTNSLGWVCGESRIFRTTNDGRTWDLHFDAGEAAAMNVVDAINFNNAYAGGSLNDEAVVWALNDPTARDEPILSVDDLVVFPELDPGQSHTAILPLQNVGSPGLDLFGAVLESSDPLSRFRIVEATSSAVQLAFDATPEPEFAAELDPEVFLRFEQGRTGTEYFDDSRHKHHGVPAAGVATPQIRQIEGARDRCLQFDGNDYAEIPALGDIGDDFTLSMWVDPTRATGSQFFIGKHSTTVGTNLILFGIHNGGYYMSVQNQFHSEGLPRAGWQHLVVTGKRNGSSTDTTVWRDGEVLWQRAIPAVVGDITGQPWILGADRDSGGAINQYLTGCLDDVAVFNRVLTAGEIAKLGTRSPLVGEHRARLVLNTNAGPARTVDLRATVAEPGELVVFGADLPGQQILVDGEPYTTPAAFAVKSTATTRNEWTEGSMHTVSLPIESPGIINRQGDRVAYRFQNWNGGSDNTQTFCARRTMGNQTARYGIAGIDAGEDPPPAGGGANNPTTLIEALSNTPAGPFLRITEGRVNVPALDDFTVEGSVFVSPTLIDGTLSTSPLSFPVGSATPWAEIGGSNWSFHLEPKSLRLSAEPSSLRIMGVDVSPSAGIDLVIEPDEYLFEMSLDEDFTPFPGFLEFKEDASFTIAFDGTSHSLALSGGVRAFEGPTGWEFDNDVAINLATPGQPVTIDLRDALGLPDPLFQDGVIELGWRDASSNAVFTYGPAGFGIGFDGITLDAFDTPVLDNASASLTTGGLLELRGAVGAIALGSDLSLAPPAGSDGIITFRWQAGVVPDLTIATPQMELQSSALTGGSIVIPPLAFDTTGDFDSGALAVSPLTLGAVGIIPRPDGELENNHVRLSRNGGILKLQLRAEIIFLPGCGWHQLDLSVAEDGTVTGSMEGTFCTPSSFLIEYDNSDPNFQFRKSDPNNHFEILFGSGGAFVRPNN